VASWDAGTISNFSLLVGVVLADVPGPFTGNLVAFPGSHRQLESVFREQPAVLQTVADRGDAALPRNLPFREAVQVTARAGDLVLAHYQLAHSIAPNTSPHIRYVVYYRVHARAHKPDTYRPEAMRDIWVDWAGMANVVEAARRAGTLHVPLAYTAADTTLAAGMGSLAVTHTAGRPKSAREWGRYVPCGPTGRPHLAHLAPLRRFVPISPDQFTKVAAATDPLYDREDWAGARVGMCQLSDSRPDDFMLALKASVCVALGDKDFKVRQRQPPRSAPQLNYRWTSPHSFCFIVRLSTVVPIPFLCA
jgi:hypothetical protein